jgi:hypothetical protein
MSPRISSSFLKTLAMWVVLSAPLYAGALSFSNRYRSPRNPERPVRKTTRLIILHTTEAGARSSLNKLSERGEAHYCVDEKGVVHRIVDRNREAFHAGRSMWCGHEDCDNHSIGIEVVGFHDKPVTLAQIDAIRELVAVLKREYRLKDTQVVCHSHVAYGAPNKWHKRKHRGRKRCGMLFAMPSVRGVLKLDSRPAFDPDVKAKRLIVADKELNAVLYGSVDTMVKTYGKAAIKNVDPTKSKPVKTDGSKKGISGEVNSRPATAQFKTIPQTVAELNAQGFKVAGTVTKKNLPLNIVGRHWNAKDTYYAIRGRVIPGNIINPKRFEDGMTIWRKPTK